MKSPRANVSRLLAIPRRGLVETTAAKIMARYGYWPESYLAMLGGASPPKHVVDHAAQLKSARYWEDTTAPAPKPAAPDAPVIGSWWDDLKPAPKKEDGTQ